MAGVCVCCIDHQQHIACCAAEVDHTVLLSDCSVGSYLLGMEGHQMSCHCCAQRMLAGKAGAQHAGCPSAFLLHHLPQPAGAPTPDALALHRTL